MKAARFVLKIVTIALTVAAAACCVVAYWDKIVDAVEAVRGKCCACRRDPEYADYADWDD